MNRIIVTPRVDRDGVVHVDVGGKRQLTAEDLFRSGLVGIWADRSDVGDSRAFSRQLRVEAQTRRKRQ